MSKPRGTLPDAVKGSELWIIKSCSSLRLTHQIRLLTFMATTLPGGKAVIIVGRRCVIDERLRQYVAEHSQHLEIRVSSKMA